MKTIIIKIIAGIAIIGAAGTVGSLYTQVWNPGWNPFEQKLSPEIVIAEMGAKMAGVKFFIGDINFDMVLVSEEVVVDIKTNITGDVDNINFENPKSATDFYFSFSAIQGENPKSSLEETEFSLTGKSITIGEDIYIKITKMPEIPSLYMFTLDDFTNQWIKMDEKVLGQTAGVDVGSEDYESFTQEQEHEKKKIMEKLIEIWQAGKIFEVKEELPEQMIDNKAFYHYLVVLNQEELKKLIKETTEGYIKEDMEKMSISDPFHMLPINKISEEQMQESINDFYKEMDEFFEKTGEISAEIWIGKQDKLFYRLKFEKEIDISQFDEKEQGTVSLKLDLNLSNFDEPMNIEAPKDFKTLEEIFESISNPIYDFLGDPTTGDFPLDMVPPVPDGFLKLQQEFPQGFPIELE